LFVDELAALGRLPPLEDAFGLVRGFGVQIVAVLQDLPQLKALYHERWETFIGNAGVVYGFAPNDLTTAKWMSDRSGTTTVKLAGSSESSGMSFGGSATNNMGTGTNTSEHARALFLPHELIGLDKGMVVAWFNGFEHTSRLFAPDYTKITRCLERAQANPY
jgi:type IV secretion system protein VirD4